MTERCLLDTNVIVRYVTNDYPPHTEQADQLFEAADSGKITFVLLPLVLMETVLTQKIEEAAKDGTFGEQATTETFIRELIQAIRHAIPRAIPLNK